MIFKNLFKKKPPATGSNLFDNAPFLTPWYITEDKPILKKDGKELKWKFIDKIGEEYVGLISLLDKSENVLGLVKTYNYIHPSKDGSKFLIWSRENKSEDINTCVNIALYSVSELSVKEVGDNDILKFNESQKTVHFFGNPITSIKYYIDPSIKSQAFAFQPEFKIFEPFLVVANCCGLYGVEQGFGDTVILEFNPSKETIHCYQQDWFNKSNADLGYQWITRAVRDNDGFIHGQGIRISDFVLDETGTQLLMR